MRFGQFEENDEALKARYLALRDVFLFDRLSSWHRGSRSKLYLILSHILDLIVQSG